MSRTPVLALAIALVASATLSPASLPSSTMTKAIIHMHGFAFIPKTLTIAAGTSVTVINDDEISWQDEPMWRACSLCRAFPVGPWVRIHYGAVCGTCFDRKGGS